MKTRVYFFVLLFWQWGYNSTAQQTGILQQLPEEELSAIEAIALYPEKERAAVLEASLYPEILVRMESIRRATEVKYKEKIVVLPEEDQRKIYNLARYPRLLEDISKRTERLSDKEMDDLLQNYPAEIHEDARYCNKKHFSLVRDIEQLYRQADDAFTSLLSSYPEPTRQAYEELAKLPGVVTILAENMSMTVLLGDVYRSNPGQLTHELDSLNIIVAEQRAKELADWKQELEENPEAAKEYEAAAQEFAAEQGYDDDVYSAPSQGVYTNQVYVDYIWQPYPYWFGWPYWYTYPCWYPYPWWYHWGYYYGPGDVMVVVGLPSSIFIGWHFYDYNHYYHYPHFTDQVIDHYYGPRHTGAVVQPVMRSMEESKRSALPADWYKDPDNRVERIKEYGKFKMDYTEAVKVSADRAPTENDFLKTNSEQYPTLKPLIREMPTKPESNPKKPRDYEPYPKTNPEQYVPKEKIIEKTKTPTPEAVDRAKEIHENTWDKLRTSPKTAPQAPPRQTSPTRQPPQKSQAPPRQSAPPKQSAPPRQKN